MASPLENPVIRGVQRFGVSFMEVASVGRRRDAV
jgi:hypothetical protein